MCGNLFQQEQETANIPKSRGCPSGRASFYGREIPERQKSVSVHFWADTPQREHRASLADAGNVWGRSGGRELAFVEHHI